MRRVESWALDRSALAERLAADRDGSLAAEGMLMMLRHPTNRSGEMLRSHLNDARVNFLLHTNSDLAKICLHVLGIERKPNRTHDEENYLRKWLGDDSAGQ